MRRLALASILAFAVAAPVSSQQPAPPVETGWEWFGLPALNFDSDEGFGYGALLELYNYGSGVKPYRFMIRPLVLFTTKGRRDVTVWFDAPRLLPEGWRLDAFVGREQHLATPYYGVGNNTVKNDQLSEPPDAYYYRYGRTQLRIAGNLQRQVAKSARLLVGAGFADVETDPVPFDSGTTLLAQQLGTSIAGPEGNLVSLRAGAVLDTRDREIGPSSGHWVDVIAQRVGGSGTPGGYNRFTATARKYASINDRLVFAQRIAVQQTDGSVPLFDLATMQTVSGQSEALGGGGSVRGVAKNRFVGKGVVFSNSELRYRVSNFKLVGKSAYTVVNAFVDAGRVWSEGIVLGEIVNDLHAGYGGGFRLGLGPSFLVALDIGRSSESTQIYIGLGYPF